MSRCPISKPVNFTIDTRESDVSIKVNVISPSGRSIPVKINSLLEGKYQAEFSPSEVGPHLVHILMNGEPISGSPFACNVHDVSKIRITNLGVAPLGKPTTFSVDASQAGEGTLELVITNQKSSVRAEVSARSRGLYDVTFCPQDSITHFVNISFNDEDVPGSPFSCEVVDDTEGNRILAMGQSDSNWEMRKNVRQINQWQERVDEAYTTHEESNYGYRYKTDGGVDEVDVGPTRARNHPIKPARINQLTNGHDTWTSSLDRKAVVNNVGGTASDSGTHSLDRRSVNKYEKTESISVIAKGGGLSSKQTTVGQTATFDVDTKGIDGDIQVKITGPDDKIIHTKVTRIRHGLFRVEYTATVIGSYHIEAFHESAALFRKPFKVEVCDPAKLMVSDIKDGTLGKEMAFKIDTSNAGYGLLMVSIRAAGQEVKHQLINDHVDIYKLLFVPKTATVHKIDVRYNGHKVPGFPKEINVKDPSAGSVILASGLGLHQGRVNKAASFVIETLKFDVKDFDVIITGPGDSLVPLKCYQQKDGNLLAEFTPFQVGAHYIEVVHQSKPISGSPFICQAFNSNKVGIEKLASMSYGVNEKISFKLNRRDAGFAELDVTVTSPLGRHLPIEVRSTSDGYAEIIEFIPTVAGKYKIAITYGGEEIPGSPIIFTIEDEGFARAFGDGLSVGLQDSPVHFKVDGQGLHGEPHVQVDGPETVASCSIEEEEDGKFLVTYVPKEVGVFDVRVFWNNKEVPGSPFHPKVVNTKRVRVIGGWDSLLDSQNRMALVTGEEKKLSFDCSEAGPGKLSVEVRGPNGMIHSQVEQTGSSRYKMSFTPTVEGEHLVYLYYAGLHLPHSPVLAYAERMGLETDATRVILKGRGLAVAHIGEETDFVIDGAAAGPGTPEVSFSGVKADVNVNIQRIGNNVYRATYMPIVSGSYLVNVMWSGRLVKGCPVKVNVVAVANAGRVICAGDGLQGGVVGKELKTFIDTRKAGSGELTAQCLGPSKTAHCDLYDHGDGTFSLFIKPQEQGRHVLTIKYGAEHIPGSPFTVRIAGAPDASKVRVYGPGIEPGVLATYQSRFICETRGAGAGQLTVRIRGPKGAFRVEMQRESQKDRTILCKYDPTEPGDYRIEVKWSGEHVPGSPFGVMIFDTKEELNRYKQGMHSPTSPNSDYMGNGTYSTAYGQVTFGQPSWRGSQTQL